MKKKYTQHDLVTLALVERGVWCRGFELERVFTHGQVIGSEADTRCYELFDKDVDGGELQTATRKIHGDTYTIQTRRFGRMRMFKAFLSSKKPVQKVEELPNGSVRISYVQEKLEEPILVPETW